MTLQGQRGKRITIISAYRVCYQNISTAGEKTAYMQQWAVLRQKGHGKPNPRQTHLDDLCQHIQTLRTDGHSIILLMDANEEFHHRQQYLATFTQRAGLTDIIYTRFTDSDTPPPRTYKRGQYCIDYALTSWDLIPYIEQCGYTPFDEVSVSDHRGIFVDIRLNDFLQCRPASIQPPSLRTLSTTNPRNIRCYKATLFKYLHEHKWFERMQKLRQHNQETTVPEETKLAVAQGGLNDLLRGMKLAETKLKQRPENPFSSALADQRKWSAYWKSWMSELTTGTELREQRKAILHDIKSQCPNVSTTPTLQYARVQWRTSRKAECEMEAHAKDLRIVFLAERMEFYNLQGNSTVMKILDRIRRKEARSSMWKKFTIMTNNNNTKGRLSHIRLPQADGTFQEVYNPTEIVRLLTERNYQHFGQANNTPFATEPIKSTMGRNGEHHASAVQSLLDDANLTEPP